MRTHGAVLAAAIILLGALACVRPASDVEAVRVQLDSARAELDQTRHELDSTRAELDQTRHELDSTTARFRYAETRKLEVIEALSALAALYTQPRGVAATGSTIQKVLQYLSDDCLRKFDLAAATQSDNPAVALATRDSLLLCVLEESAAWLR